MIEQLHIQGIGVIVDAQVDLGPGLTVITGETGAGKTMILSGIELLRGARAESGQLRESGEQAEVDAVVTVDQERQKLLGDVLEDLGVDIEDDALIARRTVSGNGRSRAYLSGRPVPVSALTATGGQRPTQVDRGMGLCDGSQWPSAPRLQLCAM